MYAFNHRKIRVHHPASIIGITLIELMLALFISSSILLAVLGVFAMYQKNSRIQSELIDEVNKNNVIQHVLGESVKSAGYVGCHTLTKDFFIDHPSFQLMPWNCITGNDQMLRVKYAASQGNLIIRTDDQVTLVTNTKPIIHAGVWMLVSDCRHAEVVHVDKVFRYKAYQEVKLAEPLRYVYQSYAELSQLQDNRFFVDRTSHKSNALYRLDLAGHKIELLSGVDHLQFKYLEKYQDEVQVRKFNEVNDWGRVVGVEVTVTLANASAQPWQRRLFLSNQL